MHTCCALFAPNMVWLFVTVCVMSVAQIHTPDSSRYWLADSYESRLAAGQEPQNIDKEFLRLWFRACCDPYKDKVRSRTLGGGSGLGVGGGTANSSRDCGRFVLSPPCPEVLTRQAVRLLVRNPRTSTGVSAAVAQGQLRPIQGQNGLGVWWCIAVFQVLPEAPHCSATKLCTAIVQVLPEAPQEIVDELLLSSCVPLSSAVLLLYRCFPRHLRN